MVMTAPRRELDRSDVLEALRAVADPEIPNVSVVDLGMIGAIDAREERIDVELLPTFVGCPALEMIRSAIEDRLAGFGRPVEVTVSFATPWSSDRITKAGREALRSSGFAPPADPELVQCPYCGSNRVAMDSAFGPTQCRSLFYCRACRQPFEAFKPI